MQDFNAPLRSVRYMSAAVAFIALSLSACSSETDSSSVDGNNNSENTPTLTDSSLSNNVPKPDFDAVWMPSRVALDDPRWRIEDLACDGCTAEGFALMQTLLANPENNERSIAELKEEISAFEKMRLEQNLTAAAQTSITEHDASEDPALDCTPDGDSLAHQVGAPIPNSIEQLDDRVMLRYEYWNAERTAYTDGRPVPSDLEPSRLGFSTAHYEGDTLVVETTGLIPWSLGVGTRNAQSINLRVALSDQLKIIERFSLEDDGNRLLMEFALIDPVNLKEPLVEVSHRLRSPGWTLEPYICEETTGEF